jgi:hypothetical protein
MVFLTTMFCPNCGKSEQIPNSYCRQCGEFLNFKTGSTSKYGGNSPLENLGSINSLSLIGAIFSVFAAVWMYATQMQIPIVLYFGAVILLCNAAWHFSNFFVGVKLKRRLKTARQELSKSQNQVPTSVTKEFLPQADFESYIQKSITENTTKELIKVKTKLS